MKKAGLICLLILTVLIIVPFAIAEDENVSTSDKSKIDKTYQCLEDKVKNECSTSLQDNIFTLLAINKCYDEIIDASDNKKCWPESDCSIKTTAQAVLAFDKAGHSSSDAEDWLLEQNKTPSDITWYLEVESPRETTCTISYGSGSYSVIIGADKKISSPAGSCLALSDGVYWFRVSPSCYGEEFKISCDEQFLTTLLFKKKDSLTIHVSEETSSSSAEGTTTEKINSFCFTRDNTCDYEGSLWATMVLDNLDYDMSAYIPYLITMTDGNDKYIPESFLYTLTGSTDFRLDLLLKQKNSQYWDESGDKFYDTALALYAFQYEEIQEKSNSKDWLLNIQGTDGCWDGGKIVSNAFILYSLWPRGYSSGNGGGGEDCGNAGHYCMPGIECGGNILDNYECSGVAKCCDTPRELESCQNQQGAICTSGYTCVGGVTVDASDTNYGEQCCVSGICELNSASSSDCESSGGTCRTYECNDDEEESLTYTCDYGDNCCIKKTQQGSYWWLWLLAVLIILVIIAIIFKDKLRPYYYRIKFMFKGGSKPEAPPSAFPATPRGPISQRRIFSPNQRQEPVRRPVKRSSEIDEVLKKLKEMGK